MQRRHFLQTMFTGWALWPMLARSLDQDKTMKDAPILPQNDNQWRQRLNPEAFHVLRQEGTEPPFTSPLNQEKRPGTFVCAGCDLPLFDASMKYESGTGWPSFYTTLPGAVETRLDFKLLLPRTEYHCTRCGGHQGHVFEDGPPPTGKRYCNNGVALRFIPS
ncbi:MAG: peptide-methionine (R)-S-oxide reductase MsrB [Magnetococcales bacterium]|nr:peptide-methionine (R)-S-oxide reductase MsrB [Magnetococcales bacterium]NGZ29002.1 peptide-methionine (R)-S-oxide reductase MsrB [Magnetococcales bacterium]